MQVVLYDGRKMVVAVVLIYTTGYHQDYRLLLYILTALLTDNTNCLNSNINYRLCFHKQCNLLVTLVSQIQIHQPWQQTVII